MTLVLGRYRIVDTIVRGSFGGVVKVADTERRDAPRALKLGHTNDAMVVDEFAQLARLAHPSLPEVFEVGRTTEDIAGVPAGAAFFVAAWIDGGRADERAWDGPALWRLARDLAGALATIHGAGLVHGDVAPQNVLVDEGARVAVLVDLGLASTTGARGTPAYMAPEAFAGLVEARSDLWGLGATLFRLATGHAPFGATSIADIVHRTMTASRPIARDLATPFADLIARLLAVDPDARPASALAVIDELDQIAPAIGVTSAPRSGSAASTRRSVPSSWPGAMAWSEALAVALDAPGSGLQVVVGDAGSGARELVDAAVRRAQLARVGREVDTAQTVHGHGPDHVDGNEHGHARATASGDARTRWSPLSGTLDEVAVALGVDARAERGFVERAARAIASSPRPVIVELGDDPRGPALLTGVARAGARAAIAIIDELPPALATMLDEAGDVRAVPLVGEVEIHALATRAMAAEPPRGWAHELHTATGGRGRDVLDLLRAIADEREPYAVEVASLVTRGLAGLRAKRLRAVSGPARALACAVVAWGGRVRSDRALATARTLVPSVSLAEVAELEHAGLARRTGGDLAIERATVRAADTELAAEVSALAAAALDSLFGAGPVSPSPAASSSEVRPVFARGGAAAPAPLAHAPSEGSQVARVPTDATDMRGGDHGHDHRHDDVNGPGSVHVHGHDRGPDHVDGRAHDAATNAVGPDAVAALLEHAPPEDRRAQLACDVAESLLVRGRPDRARALLERAAAGLPARAKMLASRAAAASGAYRDAIALAHEAAAAGADPVEAALAAARAAQRAGDLDAAEAALAALHRRHPAHVEVAGAYARLLVTRSRFADARAVAAAGDAPLAGLRAEALGLAAFYLGDLEDADRAFAALELAAGATGDGAASGRALSLRGMVAQQRGQLGVASERYREAAHRLDDAAEIHAAAVAELNLGTTLSERGRASEALPYLAAASRVFADLRATTEGVAADLNRGNALLAVGQPADALTAATAALSHADGAPHLRAFALLVAGDAHRRLGADATAVAVYREALALAIDRDDSHALVSACVALAEAGIDPASLASGSSRAETATGASVTDEGSVGARRARRIDVEAACTSADDRDRWTLARARLRLGAGAGAVAESPIERARAGDAGTPVEAHEAAALARACAQVAARASSSDRLERAFRAHSVAARLAVRARDIALARAQADLARGAHAAIVAAAAPAFRAAIEADPDLAHLAAAAPAPAASVLAPPSAITRAAADAPYLRRLLALSRRLNTETDVARILDEVIDTAIELTTAERGFLLLRRGPDGELAPVVSRNFAAEHLAAEASAPSLSRSIAERAAQSGEPVITIDAGVDERFGAAASVAALRLRSVLAVPLRQRGTVIGCIYVDHRLRGGAFDDAAASVLGELADLAAIAIENARLTDDLRRTTREVDALAGKLSAELAERDAELVRVKADLPDRDRLRNRYERIVGRSPAMVRMLEILERAAATALPVVIVGESGTGKELVARALHDHGPRAAGPFVALNCSAVPEPLLESELFGHTRGSFTGADRDRRGLFEVADGGTLFLDEIADTGAAMQAKLLRVLQDGMIRRVGDSKTRQVDVRVIVASQRPLAELAAAGTFRDDLRYRLEVITVPVPPLRDRAGDVPLLVDALLRRMSGSAAPPRLTRAALRALDQHRWPGNVRELENALARGLAMGGDVIDVGDLPESIAGATARPEPARPTLGDDLRLRPAIQATEQAYITAAMTRAKNNQTVAARLLGLSRFGLQKKLRRLAGDPEVDDES